MVICKSMDRILDELSCLYIQCFGCFLYFLLEVPGNGSCKVYFYSLISILHDVASEELGEA